MNEPHFFIIYLSYFIKKVGGMNNKKSKGEKDHENKGKLIIDFMVFHYSTILFH